ncbi:MAG: hypothetical protein KAI66_26605, partial [Lentisphaeria bacterium]|nr:hypothetical protein [Lentisphaeria bacterium]
MKTPANARPGLYKGAIVLRAKGWSARVPLHVRVYGFELPNRMTCQTAFGFNPGAVWRYQKLTSEADRRTVLNKYLRNFADHHISPYDPCPLDPFRVSWEGGPKWRGGKRVEDGQGHALMLVDKSETGRSNCGYDARFALPAKGLRLRFRYRMASENHASIATLLHHRADGGWMSGCNNDMVFQGGSEWRSFDRTLTSPPAGAKEVTLKLWATRYSDGPEAKGTVWYDDVSLMDLSTGRELLDDGDFEATTAPALRPKIDWAAWDQTMTKAIGEYGFNTFRMPIQGLGGGTFHARREPSLLGFPEDTPQYQTAMKNYLGMVQAHLAEKGWLEEAFVYWFDEPAPKDYEFVMNGFRRLKTHAPSLRRMLTEQVEDELVGGPNLWCPVSHHFGLDKAQERRAEGDSFWWYVCTG